MRESGRERPGMVLRKELRRPEAEVDRKSFATAYLKRFFLG